MIDESWKLKSKFSTKIVNNKISNVISLLKKNNFRGLKILGAGGGGFILFYVKEKYRYKVLNNLKKLNYVPFKFEDSGSKIIY